MDTTVDRWVKLATPNITFTWFLCLSFSLGTQMFVLYRLVQPRSKYVQAGGVFRVLYFDCEMLPIALGSWLRID